MMNKASRETAIEQLRALPDVRLSLPAAHGDPAFQACLRESIEVPELVAQFDRLYGANLVTRQTPLASMIDQATGKQEDDMRFIICPICGNKRCPRATDHRNACTGSNEPGQKGSSWEHYKRPGQSAIPDTPRLVDQNRR